MIKLKKAILPITFLFLLSGCVATVDPSLKEMAAGNINLSQDLAAKELAELEAQFPRLSGRKAADNAMTRIDKAGSMAALYLGYGHIQKAIDLCERYIKRFPEDYTAVNQYYSKHSKGLRTDVPTGSEAFTGKLCSLYRTLISAYTRMNDYEKANLCAREALQVHSRVRFIIRKWVASTLYPALFDAFLNSKDTEYTEKMVKLIKTHMAELDRRPNTSKPQGLDMANMDKMPFYQSLAIYNYHKGNYRQAETFQRQYLKAIARLMDQTRELSKKYLKSVDIKIEIPPSIEADEFVIDCLIKQNRVNEAWQMAQQLNQWVAQYQPEFKNSPQFWASEKLIGDLHLLRGQKSVAIESYQRSADNVEQLRSRLHHSRSKMLYATGIQELYDSLITCLAEEGRFAEAFQYSERARARAFLDLMGSRTVLVKESGANHLMVQRDEILSRIEKTNHQLKRQTGKAKQSSVRAISVSSKKLQKIERDISQQFPELASTITQNTISLDELKAALEPDTQFIEYYLTDKHTFVWLVDKNSFNGKMLKAGRQEITQLVHACRKSISSLKPQKKSASEALYDLLIRPIETKLNKTGRVYLTLHGILHHLPFQVLSKNGHYLMEDYTFVYAPSASVFNLCRNKRTGKEMTLLALGNPDLNDPNLSLPYAQKEVEALQSSFPGSAIFIGRSANKKAFLNNASRYKLIHLATHGTYNAVNPMRSGLILAGTDKEERILTAEQVFNYHFNAYSVTLSACETGIGKAISGDELVSISRAFLYAGTPSVVSTLWSVNDEATAYLMVEYYNNLKQTDKARALRQAQLKTMKKYPHPFYWGAFVLIGDWM